MTSRINGKSYQHGELEVTALDDLRKAAVTVEGAQRITFNEVIGNVQTLHLKHENRHALFQAASQFNLLEMAGPSVTPEQGVEIYEFDRTQGPACAIACGAGTIYRNYFVPLKGQLGQSEHCQIDGLELIGEQLENPQRRLWQMRNGYALLSEAGLRHINSVLADSTVQEYEDLKGKLKIGIQWNTEVTSAGEPAQKVFQIYCSALPIGYTRNIDPVLFEKFAPLILEATYEATFLAGLKNFQQFGARKIFLTLVGGGVFENKIEWIVKAIEKCLIKYRHSPLEVMMISYGSSNTHVQQLVRKYQSY